MKAILVYLECNHFSGIMRILIDQTIFSIELGTPHFNDYGEYRLSTENKTISLAKYFEIFPNSKLINHEICELSPTDLEFWKRFEKVLSIDEESNILTNEDIKDIEITEDGNGYVIGGRGKDEEFYVYSDKAWQIYDQWKSKDQWNPYNKLMYPCVELFFNWFNKKIVLPLEPNKSDMSLNIYPNV